MKNEKIALYGHKDLSSINSMIEDVNKSIEMFGSDPLINDYLKTQRAKIESLFNVVCPHYKMCYKYMDKVIEAAEDGKPYQRVPKKYAEGVLFLLKHEGYDPWDMFIDLDKDSFIFSLS